MDKTRYILVIALLLVSVGMVVTGCESNSTSFAQKM